MTKQLEQNLTRTGMEHGMIALQSQGEARLNRLLRRVDWRFLTGKPYPKRSLVLGGGVLAEALELVCEAVLANGEAPPGSVDLVAASNPGQAELELAWQALEPGGTLYGEWYIPRPGGPALLRQRLAKIGFLPTGSYWPWPWPERAAPAFWLPLEAPGALGYFLESRPPARSLAAQILHSGLQLAWRTGLRTGLLAPVCIVAHKPQAPGETGPPPGSLPAWAASWGLVMDGARLDWLLLTGGLHSTNKVTALVFEQGAGKPNYVIKMPRRKLSLPSLEREAAALQAVQSSRAKPLSGVPQLVFRDSTGTFPAIGETHLSGIPLYTAMQFEPLEGLAQQATGWLLGLVNPGPQRPPEAWWNRVVAPVLEDFERGYATLVEQLVLEAARAELARLGPLPQAVEHRDFSPWNVFRTSNGGLAVLDWEGAEPNGLPFSDLVYFLANLTFFAEGALESGTAPASYARMLDPNTRMGAIAAICFREYLAGSGMAAEAQRPLRVLTWMRQAVLERRLIENSSADQPEAHLLRRGLSLSLLRKELELSANG